MTATLTRLPREDRIIEIHKDKQGELHHDHRPALIYKLAHHNDIIVSLWFKHGVYHNEWGPADIMEQNGSQIASYWFIDGIEVADSYDEWEDFLKLRGLSKEDRVTLKMMV